MWLRVALVVVLVLALARPQWVRRSAGSDLVILVDRSRSMPPGAEAQAQELIELAWRERRPGDRVGVISFGREPRVEVAPAGGARFAGFTQTVDPDASDLASALDRAWDLIPRDRTGRVLVISDGRATGADPRGAARRLSARGIAIDYRYLARETSGVDLAVTALDVPSSVAVKEPFQLTATVHATEAVQGTVLLLRNGQPLVKGPYRFEPGPNLLTFRDLIDKPGVASYALEVETPVDQVVENDVGRAVLRVEGPPRVLLVSAQGGGGLLARTVREVGIDCEVKPPGPLSMADLEGVGALVLENVDASALSESGLQVISQYVKEAGGGLVMTGGRKSFGEGGYRRSPVEDLLPVSLEMRQEQRKAAIAMSILMDCSCSMGVTVPDGRTKMQLAGEGAVAALQLLNEEDEASVDVVDTEVHELVPMTAVKDGLPYNKVAQAFSGGGGIYVGVALEEGRRKILESHKATRHVVLFADANDSEEPGRYKDILAELRARNVTVSVIGMGKPTDSDAALLQEVATLGGGRIYFAEDATSLPRIFSQETIAVARAAFVDAPVAVKPGGDLTLLGKVPRDEWPTVGGYNLTYLKPQASVALRSSDDNEAPILAFWPKGTGRVVAFTAEADGEYTGPIRDWRGYRALIEQMVRWTMPPQPPEARDFVARATRHGNDLHVTLDFDPDHAPAELDPKVLILSGDGSGAPAELAMRWEDEDRLGAHFTLPGPGSYHPVVKLGNRVVRAPPVALPYAPEFEPGSAKEGKATLGALALLSGGVERLSMTGLFQNALESEAPVPLAPVLVTVALLMLLAEVFVRRFLAGRPERVAELTDHALRAVLQQPAQMARRTAPRKSAERPGRSPSAGPGAAVPVPPSEVPPEAGVVAVAPAPAASEPKKDAGIVSALDMARERARRRTQR
ncbi:MAG: VWA domain-containing protein [Myxococcaceae bacterium]|nr:VWA domain-containing protein [Myxococcaceae bacterium]